MTDLADQQSANVRESAERASASVHANGLEILAYGWWTFGGGIQAEQRLEGQLTKCRWFGIVFYVRENIDNRLSFYISSNERMQEKGSNRGTTGPAAHRQILDVCTAKESDWEIAADVVRCLDAKARPVRRNRLFTVQWAERQLHYYRH